MNLKFYPYSFLFICVFIVVVDVIVVVVAVVVYSLLRRTFTSKDVVWDLERALGRRCRTCSPQSPTKLFISSVLSVPGEVK